MSGGGSWVDTRNYSKKLKIISAQKQWRRRDHHNSDGLGGAWVSARPLFVWGGTRSGIRRLSHALNRNVSTATLRTAHPRLDVCDGDAVAQPLDQAHRVEVLPVTAADGLAEHAHTVTGFDYVSERDYRLASSSIRRAAIVLILSFFGTARSNNAPRPRPLPISSAM